MKSVRWLALLAAVAVSWSTAGRADDVPQRLVVDTTEEVLRVLRENREQVASDPAYVNRLIDEKIVPHLDFPTMTKLAVAKHWKQAEAGQREALVGEFRTLLLRTYSKSLTQYRDQEIVFKPYEPESREDRAVVRSEFRQDGGGVIPVDYKLWDKGGWKIYDITIDGISLVTNYRSSFTAEIQKGGIDGLIASLRSKNQSGE